MVNFKSLLAQATDPSQKEPDLGATFDFVEEIQRAKKSGVKDAVAAIRRSLLTGEATVQYHTIEVLNACMKNCGEDFYVEVFSKSFMEAMKTVIKESGNDKLINRALELLSEWNAGLTASKGHGVVKETCAELQRDGIFFPEVQVAKSSFVEKIEKAPEWVKGERCFYCRDEFSMMSFTKGRHHCRNCGKSVCGGCSGNTIPLPHYNMQNPVRVCDVCYRKVKSGAPIVKDNADVINDDDGVLPEEYLRSSLAKESQKPSSTREAELQEQEELDMAMAMSLSDQPHPPSSSSSSQPRKTQSSSTTSAPIMQATDDLPMYRDIPSAPSYDPLPEPEYTNPQLNAYLDRGRWEQQKQQQQQKRSHQQQQQKDIGPSVTVVPNSEPSFSSGSPLAVAMKKTIETFLQRMQKVNATGKSIAADASVQTMFESLTVMHPQLLAQLEALQEQKSSEEGVLRKVDEVKQARVSLNAMRRQHLERVRQQEEEQSLLARMQMEQKLALLRQQKNEQLTFQKELENKRREEIEEQESKRLQALQEQLEMERSRLKMQEQQLFQQQFGSYVVPGMQQMTMTDYPSSLPSGPPEPISKGTIMPDMYSGMSNPTVGYTTLPGGGYSYQNPSLTGTAPSLNVQPPSLNVPPPGINVQPSSLPPPNMSQHLSGMSVNPQPSGLPLYANPQHGGVAPDVTNPLLSTSVPAYQQPSALPTAAYGTHLPSLHQAPSSTGYMQGIPPADVQYNQPNPSLQHAPPMPQQAPPILQQAPPPYNAAPPNMYGMPPPIQPVQEAELISFD